MTNLILKSTLFLGAALTMGLNARAERVNIPFAFEATGKSMPAGEYSVTSVAMDDHVFAMVNTRTHDSVLLNGNMTIGYANERPKLVFNQTEDGYYLTEIWNGSIGKALTCPRAKRAFLAATKPATRVSVAIK